VLKTVTYQHTGDDPVAGTHTIRVTADDRGTGDEVTAEATVVITADNDLPVIDLDTAEEGNHYSVTIDEGDSDVPVSGEVAISDADHDQFVSVTITLTRPPGEDDALDASGISEPTIAATGSDTQIVLTRSGGGSTIGAAFENSIEDIVWVDSTFPEDADLTDRIITIVVNDGEDDSLPAMTTLSINDTDLNNIFFDGFEEAK
jgi:hypothetical protein